MEGNTLTVVRCSLLRAHSHPCQQRPPFLARPPHYNITLREDRSVSQITGRVSARHKQGEIDDVERQWSNTRQKILQNSSVPRRHVLL